MSSTATAALTLVFIGLLYAYLWFVARSVGSHLMQAAPAGQVAALPSRSLVVPAGPTYQVDKPVVAGRGPGADIVLDDPFASELHGRLSLDEGRLKVTDLDSTNGTFVNDNRISGSAVLNPGDTVRLGETIMEVR